MYYLFIANKYILDFTVKEKTKTHLWIKITAGMKWELKVVLYEMIDISKDVILEIVIKA